MAYNMNMNLSKTILGPNSGYTVLQYEDVWPRSSIVNTIEAFWHHKGRLARNGIKNQT